MYSLLSSLIEPLTLSFLLIGMTLAWAWWKHPDARRGLRAITLAFVLAWLASTRVVAYFSAGLLEWRYPPVLQMPEDADAIVLLSGGAFAPTDFLPQTRPSCDTLRRCRAAAQLYHTRPCPILACGGKVRSGREGDTLAQVMRTELIAMGVEPGDILLDESSRNTHQNVAEAGRMIDEQGWRRAVVVTDATHLLRTQWCFEKGGTEIVPAGAHYVALHPPQRFCDFFPSANGAKITATVLHETLGIVSYKLRGHL